MRLIMRYFSKTICRKAGFSGVREPENGNFAKRLTLAIIRSTNCPARAGESTAMNEPITEIHPKADSDHITSMRTSAFAASRWLVYGLGYDLHPSRLRQWQWNAKPDTHRATDCSFLGKLEPRCDHFYSSQCVTRLLKPLLTFRIRSLGSA